LIFKYFFRILLTKVSNKNNKPKYLLKNNTTMGCGCKKRNEQPAQPVSIKVNEVKTPAPTSIPTAQQ
jgi:hypothetical protein